MKKLIRKIFFIFILVSFFRLLAVSTCVSQHGFECGFIDSSGSFSSSIFDNQFTGLTKPIRTDLSGDTSSPSSAVFPVIIVFVQFLGDNDDWQWPAGQPPLYLDSIIAETKSYNSDWWDAYDENTEQFSDYWLEVSRGKFHVTGKAFSVVLDKNANGYASDHEINIEIWRKLHEEIVDWRPYDRWRDTLINGQMKFYYEQDGYVDMIYKVHKNNDGPLG
ncbi:MAG: hypothetical protein IPM38_15935 [Ignavibacteria bacterium]|nr:hypothetical protein [Ignavibacteria bacterium]